MREKDLLSSFAAPTVLVQGASRGIGLELTRQLLASPHVRRVYATCRSARAAVELQGFVRSDPERLSALDLDVCDEASVAAAAAAVRELDSSLNLVVNCAGLLHDDIHGIRPERRLSEVEPEAFVRSMRVNALGPLLVAKHFEPLLRSPERTVFASISARVGSITDNRLGGWYAYRASKAAQNMVTRNLSIELRRRSPGVICVALHPGTVDTGLSRPFQSKVPAGKLFSVSYSASKMLAVIDALSSESNGRFFAWDGSEMPW